MRPVLDALVGGVGLVVLLLACAGALALDVLRHTAPPARRRQLGVGTAVLVAAGLALTVVRVLALL